MRVNRFYLACFRDNVGSNVGFHGVDGAGYYTDLSRAHVYSLDEAQKSWEHAREYDQPISADHIDELSVLKVDCQYIPSESAIEQGCNEYVAYVPNRWDGNDRFWLTDKLPTTDFSKARIFDIDEIDLDGEVCFISLELATDMSRLTFDYAKYNPRKMVQGAGLKMPAHVKKERRRKESSGKTRMNCPCCGRIAWQYNPYEFENCKNVSCDNWGY